MARRSATTSGLCLSRAISRMSFSRSSSATKIPVTGRVPLFYAALGLMLLDDNARAAFGTGDFSTAGFTPSKSFFNSIDP